MAILLESSNFETTSDVLSEAGLSVTSLPYTSFPNALTFECSNKLSSASGIVSGSWLPQDTNVISNSSFNTNDDLTASLCSNSLALWCSTTTDTLNENLSPHTMKSNECLQLSSPCNKVQQYHSPLIKEYTQGMQTTQCQKDDDFTSISANLSKKAAQKIRNRLSAQQHRDRQKKYLSNIRDELELCRRAKETLELKVFQLEQEKLLLHEVNEQLQQRLTMLEMNILNYKTDDSYPSPQPNNHPELCNKLSNRIEPCPSAFIPILKQSDMLLSASYCVSSSSSTNTPSSPCDSEESSYSIESLRKRAQNPLLICPSEIKNDSQSIYNPSQFFYTELYGTDSLQEPFPTSSFVSSQIPPYDLNTEILHSTTNSHIQSLYPVQRIDSINPHNDELFNSDNSSLLDLNPYIIEDPVIPCTNSHISKRRRGGTPLTMTSSPLSLVFCLMIIIAFFYTPYQCGQDSDKSSTLSTLTPSPLYFLPSLVDATSVVTQDLVLYGAEHALVPIDYFKERAGPKVVFKTFSNKNIHMNKSTFFPNEFSSNTVFLTTDSITSKTHPTDILPDTPFQTNHLFRFLCPNPTFIIGTSHDLENYLQSFHPSQLKSSDVLTSTQTNIHQKKDVSESSSPQLVISIPSSSLTNAKFPGLCYSNNHYTACAQTSSSDQLPDTTWNEDRKQHAQKLFQTFSHKVQYNTQWAKKYANTKSTIVPPNPTASEPSIETLNCQGRQTAIEDSLEDVPIHIVCDTVNWDSFNIRGRQHGIESRLNF